MIEQLWQTSLYVFRVDVMEWPTSSKSTDTDVGIVWHRYTYPSRSFSITSLPSLWMKPPWARLGDK